MTDTTTVDTQARRSRKGDQRADPEPVVIATESDSPARGTDNAGGPTAEEAIAAAAKAVAQQASGKA